MEDHFTRIMCCLLGAVNGSYIEAGFPPISHTYISQTQVVPVCGSHGFATIRWDGKTRDPHPEFKFGNTTTECLARSVDLFTLRVGACAPPSPNLMMLAGNACPGDDLYGSCPPCDEDITTYIPAETSDECVKPTGVNPETGELIWPTITTQETHSDFSLRLIMQSQAIHKYLADKLCACLADCYQGDKLLHKSKVRLGGSDWWNEGRFTGIDIPVATMTG